VSLCQKMSACIRAKNVNVCLLRCLVVLTFILRWLQMAVIDGIIRIDSATFFWSFMMVTLMRNFS